MKEGFTRSTMATISYYSSEDQFWEIDNDVGGEAAESNGLAYLSARISANLVEEGGTYGCLCMQTDSKEDWVSTGAVQLSTRHLGRLRELLEGELQEP